MLAREFTATPEDASAEVGDVARFSCGIKSVPPADVVWEKDGRPLDDVDVDVDDASDDASDARDPHRQPPRSVLSTQLFPFFLCSFTFSFSFLFCFVFFFGNLWPSKFGDFRRFRFQFESNVGFYRVLLDLTGFYWLLLAFMN